MGTILILKDGKREIVAKDRHFEDLVREYMGDDAAQFFKDRLEDIFDVVNEAKECAKEAEIGEIIDILEGVRFDE